MVISYSSSITKHLTFYWHHSPYSVHLIFSRLTAPAYIKSRPWNHKSNLAIMSTQTDTNIEFTTGKGNKDNFIHNGFRYRLDKKRITSTGVRNSYWRCVSDGCSGRLVLHNENVVNTPQHDHDEQRADIVVHRTKKKLKNRAASSEMTAKHMVASALSGLHFECGSKLGCRSESLGKMARSAQRKATCTQLAVLLWRHSLFLHHTFNLPLAIIFYYGDVSMNSEGPFYLEILPAENSIS